MTIASFRPTVARAFLNRSSSGIPNRLAAGKGTRWWSITGTPTEKTGLSLREIFRLESTHVVERYTMIDMDTIHFEARVEDPTIYTRPWTIAIAFTRNKEPGYYQLEFACHEGERDMQHYTEGEGRGRSDVFVAPAKNK